MASGKFTILAVLAVLALSVGDFAPVAGQYNTNWKVLNGGGSNNFEIEVSTHCYSQYNNLAPVTLQPGQHESYGWEPISYLNEAYQCDFEANTATGILTQNLYIWKHDGGSGYLNGCDSCKWNIQQDGFYFQAFDGTFTKEFSWNGGPSKSRKLL